MKELASISAGTIRKRLAEPESCSSGFFFSRGLTGAAAVLDGFEAGLAETLAGRRRRGVATHRNAQVLAVVVERPARMRRRPDCNHSS